MPKNSNQTTKSAEYPSAFRSVREWGYLYNLSIHYHPSGYLKKIQKFLLVSPWLQRDPNCSKHYKIKAEKTPHESQSNSQAHQHKPRLFLKSSKKNAQNRILPIVFKPQTHLWTSPKIQFGRTDQLKNNLICLLLLSGTCLVACFLWFSTGATKLQKMFFSQYWQAHGLKRVFRLAEHEAAVCAMFTVYAVLI